MRFGFILAVMGIALASPAFAADKPAQPRQIVRLDGLTAAKAGGSVVIQARGAVSSGGWRNARLRPLKSTDSHILALEFIATPPPPGQVVIQALLPVTAKITLRLRAGVVSVRVVSAANEITTQILK